MTKPAETFARLAGQLLEASLICSLCTQPGRMWLTVGGDEYGPACESHCILMWEAYLDYVCDRQKHERDLTRWQMRREMGHDEPIPKSPAEKEIERNLRGRK